jgi:hypothetical protein
VSTAVLVAVGVILYAAIAAASTRLIAWEFGRTVGRDRKTEILLGLCWPGTYLWAGTILAVFAVRARVNELLGMRWRRFKVADHWWNKSAFGVQRWNGDKPHRCPRCHAIPDTGDPTWRALAVCCRCGTRYTRWPILTPLLPVRRCGDIERGTCPHQTAT